MSIGEILMVFFSKPIIYGRSKSAEWKKIDPFRKYDHQIYHLPITDVDGNVKKESSRYYFWSRSEIKFVVVKLSNSKLSSADEKI